LAVQVCATDGFTTQPIAVNWGTDPEFIDLHGLKRLFSIGRSAAYTLIENGDIRSVVLRRRGCVKGKRLIDVASVRQFLAAQSAEVDPRLSAICKEANRVMREKKAERGRRIKTGLASKVFEG
jgi:hypothetical protein